MVNNIPGLIESNQEQIDKNRQEIEKAFDYCPNSITMYVFGAQNRRIRDEDVIALQALNDAYSFKKSLILILNEIPRQNRSPSYEGETIVYLREIFRTNDEQKYLFARSY